MFEPSLLNQALTILTLRRLACIGAIFLISAVLALIDAKWASGLCAGMGFAMVLDLWQSLPPRKLLRG